MFTGFKVGNTCLYVSHLQYVDDTLFIGEASMENLGKSLVSESYFA
jgi:hypothetical protein